MHKEITFTITLRVSGRNDNHVALVAALTRQWLQRGGAADALLGLVYESIEAEAPEYHDGWFYSLARVETDSQFPLVSAHFANVN